MRYIKGLRQLLLCFLLGLCLVLCTACGSDQVRNYSQPDFGISIDLPGDWEKPNEVINENGLSVVASTKDMEQSIVLLIKEIPEDLANLPAYREEVLDELPEYHENAALEHVDIISINGVPFFKLVILDRTPGMETRQTIYTAFESGQSFEITITLTPDYYEKHEALFKKIEDSIKLI